MATFIHRDRIVERLEMAKTMGLVTNYSISATGPARRPDASVKVWGKSDTGENAIKEHLVRMLQGLVAQDQIMVILPFAADAPEAADDAATSMTGAVPVAA
jgi:hypothetical protein